MDIKHSRRILILGPREAGALEITKDLTGTAPQPDINGSTAGLTHEWDAKTPYYSATVPIWIDEVTDISSWKAEFLKPEAGEVVEAVGAWIYSFPKGPDGAIPPQAEEAMRAIQEVVEQHTPGADVLLLAVAKTDGKETREQASDTEPQEDTCMDYGFEYVDYAATGKNEFGEKRGFERMKEALEAHGWAGGAGEDQELDLDELDFENIGDFAQDEAEMTAELFGMKAALDADRDGDEPAAKEGGIVPPAREASQVEDLDKMLSRLMAVKEQSAGLPEQQRKRMAAQAVRDIMKENPNV